MKRILAFIGALLLIVMYLITLFFALSGAEGSKDMLMASIAATIIIPVFLYAFNLACKFLRGKGVNKDDNINGSTEDAEKREGGS